MSFAIYNKFLLSWYSRIIPASILLFLSLSVGFYEFRINAPRFIADRINRDRKMRVSKVLCIIPRVMN